LSEKPVLILAGSLRVDSISIAAARAIAYEIEALGQTAQVVTLPDLDLPLYNPDVHRIELEISRPLLELVRNCSAMVWASPSYNGSMSGSFKNMLDYLDLMIDDAPAFITGTAVGLVAVSGGPVASINTITALDMVVRSLRGDVIPYSIPITRSLGKRDDEGRFTDPALHTMFRLLAKEVVDRAAFRDWRLSSAL
jgi:NAD(P)H-dependent FMN reductase